MMVEYKNKILKANSDSKLELKDLYCQIYLSQKAKLINLLFKN